MCDYDEFEPVVFRTWKIVTTRKAHRCNCCEQVWPVGSKMRKWSCIGDGSYQQGYTCHVCDFIREQREGSKYHGCWLTFGAAEYDPAFDWELPLWQEVRTLLAEREAIETFVK